MSFPKNNPQGVAYEPWHWRFVGNSDSLKTFYTAKNLTRSASNLAPETSDTPTSNPTTGTTTEQPSTP
jgi:D-alanyl-D-alanine carboxypeptidase